MFMFVSFFEEKAIGKIFYCGHSSASFKLILKAISVPSQSTMTEKLRSVKFSRSVLSHYFQGFLHNIIIRKYVLHNITVNC